jgi:MerR family transcriptional regulator/heat shock protein HspR
MATSRGGSRAPHPSFSDLDKPLYTISVAAEILETHPRTLMLYEDANLLEPHRTATNRRRYSQRDISKVQVIQNLTREKGVTLAGVRHILSLFEVMKRHRVEPPPDLREIFDRYAQII